MSFSELSLPAGATLDKKLVDSNEVAIDVPPEQLCDLEQFTRTGKGLHFWLIFVAISVSLFMSALEIVSVTEPPFTPLLIYILRLRSATHCLPSFHN